MTDIFETTILCDKCNKKTEKNLILRNGFKIRSWQCPQCKKQWFHPADIQYYENFARLKNKNFRVKLRLVGNSYTVSIPREIIEFQREIQKEMRKMEKIIQMHLEEPEKLILFFKPERLINRYFK